MTKNNKWEWDSTKIELTDPKGKVIILDSNNFSDFFMEQCHQEIQDYLEKIGGELK